MARRTEAYVDTSALIAFADESDTHHALFRRLFSDPPPLVATSLVIAEGQAWFLKRYDTTKGLHFMSMVDEMKPLRILSTSSRDVKQGTEILRKFSDQELTLTDAVGLHVMRDRKIKICWSTDLHLGLTGVPLAIHQH